MLLANEYSYFHCQDIYRRKLLMFVMKPQVKADIKYFHVSVVSDGLVVR
jgi:hypothetical protein